MTVKRPLFNELSRVSRDASGLDGVSSQGIFDVFETLFTTRELRLRTRNGCWGPGNGLTGLRGGRTFREVASDGAKA